MTVFEKIKAMDIDEFAQWFDKHCANDTDQCIDWWNKTYCENCEPEIVKCINPDTYITDMECAWCELHDKCKFFQNIDGMPDSLQITKLWLESES